MTLISELPAGASPAADAAAAPLPAPPGRRLSRGPAITVEHLLYLGLLAAALLLHLWGLGDRALHHDETHHSYFPWLLYTGQGYTHDPLLHGPFLYFINALSFTLLGDSDYTTRLSAALFGVALTVSPWLLRRELGRRAALVAAAYLLISPVALYVGRFIRHDIFAVTFEVLCVVGLLRYVATHRPGYLYLVAASFGLMVTTMESSYLFAAIMGSFLFGVVVWHVDWRLVSLLVGYVGLVAVARALLPQPLDASGQPMPLVTDNDALLIRHRPDDNWAQYLRDLWAVLMGHETSQTTGQTGYNGLFLHLWVPVAIGLAALLGLALAYLIFWRRDAAGSSAWRRAVAQARPGSLLLALDTLRGRRVWVALSIYGAIYTTLFTAFFFNTVGVLSGTTGSFLYWLGQHDVQRGGQPAHYYAVLLSIYEPLLLVWGGLGIVLGLAYGLRHLIRDGGLSARTMMPPLLAWWGICALGVYSWAGEKMPWLTLHLVVPLTLSGAWAISRLLPRLLGWPGPSHRPARTTAGGLVVLGIFGTLTLTALARSEDSWGRMPLVGLVVLGAAALLLLCLLLWGLLVDRLRPGLALARTAGAGLLAGSLLLGAYAVRSAWMLNFQHGDIPVEIMVYVQSSPNVGRAMDQLARASIRQTGGRDLGIRYDNETIWKWYLRNYPRAQYMGEPLAAAPGPDVDVLLLYHDNISANDPMLRSFVKLRLPMRWHFPEGETYRLSALRPEQSQLERLAAASCPRASLLDRLLCTPSDPRTQAELWRYLMFRQPPAALGAVDFAVYVRPEIADMFLLSPLISAQQPASGLR